MATESPVTADDKVFVGEDKTLNFTIYKADNVTPQDVAGWTLSWVLRKRDKDPDPALIQKSVGVGVAIAGVYNADPALNTQLVVVTIADTDTDALKPLTYRYALKRMDAGSETVLAFGDFVLRQAAVR